MIFFCICIQATFIVREAECNRRVTGRRTYANSHPCPQHFSNQTRIHGLGVSHIVSVTTDTITGSLMFRK